MAGTPIPNLFLGRKDTVAEVFKWHDGATDGSNGGAGDTIYPLAKSVRWAPGGAGGEAIFTRFWIALTYNMAVTLRFTPVLDGVPQDGTGGTDDLRQTLALAGAGSGALVTERYEFILHKEYDSDAVRLALRGCWFQLLIDTTTTLGAGTMIIEQPEIEHEIVRESVEAQ